MRTAKDMKQAAINSVQKEINNMELAMNKAADKGELFLIVDSISPAAKSNFLMYGFEVKIILELDDSKKSDTNKYKISWEK